MPVKIAIIIPKLVKNLDGRGWTNQNLSASHETGMQSILEKDVNQLSTIEMVLMLARYFSMDFHCYGQRSFVDRLVGRMINIECKIYCFLPILTSILIHLQNILFFSIIEK